MYGGSRDWNGLHRLYWKSLQLERNKNTKLSWRKRKSRGRREKERRKWIEGRGERQGRLEKKEE